MLNDISGAADSSCNFDFNLSSSITQNKLKSLINSKANTSTTDSQPLTENDKCIATNDLLVSVSTNGADNLSWKFFEQVDTLDHQLRRDESSPPLLLNGGILSSSSISTSAAAATTNDATTTTTMSATLGMQHINNYTLATQSPQPLTLGTSRKSNGYAINGTLVQQSTEILSQTNATSVASSAAPHIDLNSAVKGAAGGVRPLLSQQLQQLPTEGTFVFTSPTSTFKKKKQQQLRKQEEEEAELQQSQQRYEVLHNNNNFHKNGVNGGCYAPSERAVGNDDESAANHELEDYSNTASSKGSNTSLLRQFGVQQQHQQQRVNNTHDPRKVINTSTGVIITDTVVTYASTSALSSIIVGGNGTTVTGNSNGTTTALRSTRTHTLPLITKAVATTAAAQASSTSQLPPSTYIAGGVVDLVYDTKCASSSSSAATPKSQLKSKTQFRGFSTTVSTNNTQKPRQASCNPAKMQASSSGGSGTTTTAKGFSNSSLVDDIEMHLGLLGWRKKCLYTLLVLLMLLIIINLGLTLWILKVMEFTTEGMGQLKIVPGGIQLNGQALIMDMLRASSIRSRHGQPISIESSRNFSINTRGTDGLLENHLFLGHDKLECIATTFRINDTNGRNLFSVNRDEVTIGAHALRIEGEGGAIFRESIQTPHVRAEPGRELRLESPTRQLDMTAAKDINLQSRAGGIEITALEDVKLSALDGSLRFESSKIFMPNLRTVQMPLPGTPQSREHLHRVFQLCACSNGKLFLAAPHSVCAGDDSTVCR